MISRPCASSWWTGAGTDTLLLAGETAGEVYTVPADSFPLTLDGEPADASVLEDGMPLTVAYTGIEETFPARLSIAAAEAYRLGTEKNPGGGFYDLCGLYLQVLSDLAEGGEETVAVDLSQAPGDLTEGEKAAIAWRFRETCGTGLADPESADPGIARFAIREAGTEGELCSLPTREEGEAYSLPVLKFEAERSQTLPGGPGRHPPCRRPYLPGLYRRLAGIWRLDRLPGGLRGPGLRLKRPI